MTNVTFYTVAADHLLSQAATIERDAEQSHRAWILTSQFGRYGEEMARARCLRRAAAERNVGIRREILRNCGFNVSTPRAARSAK